MKMFFKKMGWNVESVWNQRFFSIVPLSPHKEYISYTCFNVESYGRLLSLQMHPYL